MPKDDEIRLRHLLEAAREAVSFGLLRPGSGVPHAEGKSRGANRATEREADTRATENGAPS